MSDSILERQLEVQRSIPPVLVLPLAGESTEQYKTENFNPRGLDDLTRYGGFMVALIAWSIIEEGSQRVSLMPNGDDFEAMYTAGYGVRRQSLSPPEGVSAIQDKLGFYSAGSRPGYDSVFGRIIWMAQNAVTPSKFKTTEQIIQWGASRHVLPARDTTLEILGDDVREVPKLFGIEKLDEPDKRPSFLDLYRLGAMILAEHGRPLPRHKIDQRYPDVFSIKPSKAINNFFGGTNNFWLEFDLVVHGSGITEQKAVEIGVRRAIRTEDLDLTAVRLWELSKDNQLPYRPIRKIGIPAYRERVSEGYGAYKALCDRFEDQGVARDVMRVVCGRKFENSAIFETWLQDNRGVLQKISRNRTRGEALLTKIENGLALGSKPAYVWQLEETHKILHQWDLSDDEKRFAFDLIPRINTDEAMGSATTTPPDRAAFSITPRPWSRSII